MASGHHIPFSRRSSLRLSVFNGVGLERLAPHSQVRAGNADTWARLVRGWRHFGSGCSPVPVCKLKKKTPKHVLPSTPLFLAAMLQADFFISSGNVISLPRRSGGTHLACFLCLSGM